MDFQVYGVAVMRADEPGVPGKPHVENALATIAAAKSGSRE